MSKINIGQHIKIVNLLLRLNPILWLIIADKEGVVAVMVDLEPSGNDFRKVFFLNKQNLTNIFKAQIYGCSSSLRQDLKSCLQLGIEHTKLK